jgi:hypothetical protein
VEARGVACPRRPSRVVLEQPPRVDVVVVLAPVVVEGGAAVGVQAPGTDRNVMNVVVAA